MHHSITPPLHYSSLGYVEASRTSATKQMSFFTGLSLILDKRVA
jgi:hypothetical protein